MTKPIPDKAEVSLEYPDKLYVGTFERSSRFEAHLDKTGIFLALHRTGDIETRRTIHMHIHYGLFAEILRELANTVSTISKDDVEHRTMLREAARSLYRSLREGPLEQSDAQKLTPEEQELLLHVLE